MIDWQNFYSPADVRLAQRVGAGCLILGLILAGGGLLLLLS